MRALIGGNNVGPFVHPRLASQQSRVPQCADGAPLTLLRGPVIWDRDALTVTIDPCDDPERVAEIVVNDMENVKFSVFGVAKLHIADEETYRTLMNGLEDRRDQYVGEYPVIEF